MRLPEIPSRTRPDRRMAVAVCLALVIAACAVAVPVGALQDGGAQTAGEGEAGRRRDRPPRYRDDGFPSEVMTHSPLVSCHGTGGVHGVTPDRMRVATWNIRAARSAPLEEIGSELASMEPDIAALQEVDRRARRTGFRDQPATIASALGFHYAFAASIRYDGGDYGLAVVSRWPIVDVRRHPLDNTDARELRIVLDVTVCARGRPLRVLNHHADTRSGARTTSLTTLSALARARLGEGIVVLGDFNDVPDSPGVLALLGAGLVDLVERYETAPAGGRIDYLMTDPRLAGTATAATVWQTAKSDHHALIADLAW